MKQNDMNELELRAHSLADAFRDLAQEKAREGDIFGCHYAVNQMMTVGRMAHNAKRRFGI